MAVRITQALVQAAVEGESKARVTQTLVQVAVYAEAPQQANARITQLLVQVAVEWLAAHGEVAASAAANVIPPDELPVLALAQMAAAAGCLPVAESTDAIAQVACAAFCRADDNRAEVVPRAWCSIPTIVEVLAQCRPGARVTPTTYEPVSVRAETAGVARIALRGGYGLGCLEGDGALPAGGPRNQAR